MEFIFMYRNNYPGNFIGNMSCPLPDKENKPHQIKQKSLAMAYVPNQEFKDLFEPCEALKHGTMFKELNLPFCCTGGKCK